MSKTKVVWHPFPETHPPKSGDYLITAHDFGDTVNHPWVDVDYYDKKIKKFQVQDWRYNEGWCVTAWAEAPEPYKPAQAEASSDQHPDAITAKKFMERDPETLKKLGVFDE